MERLVQKQSTAATEPRCAHTPGSTADLLGSICAEIRNLLDGKRLELATEIRRYPPPIPACDAHFNYLLEERAKVTHEISCMDELSGSLITGANAASLIRAFVNGCAYLDSTAKQGFRKRLDEAQ
jgi:hypothetical protein